MNHETSETIYDCLNQLEDIITTLEKIQKFNENNIPAIKFLLSRLSPIVEMINAENPIKELTKAGKKLQ